MNDTKKSYLILVFISLSMFVFGFISGSEAYEQSDRKQITLLSIELTKLEIKKLKGVSNGS